MSLNEDLLWSDSKVLSGKISVIVFDFTNPDEEKKTMLDKDIWLIMTTHKLSPKDNFLNYHNKLFWRGFNAYMIPCYK